MKHTGGLVVPICLLEGKTSGGGQCFKDLFNKKRVALRKRMQTLLERGVRRTFHLKDGAQHPVHFGQRQALEQKLRCEVFTVELRQKMNQGGLRLINPVGKQQENRLGEQPARKQQQEFKTGIVAPVQVLDHNEQRRPARLCRRAKKVRQPVK